MSRASRAARAGHTCADCRRGGLQDRFAPHDAYRMCHLMFFDDPQAYKRADAPACCRWGAERRATRREAQANVEHAARQNRAIERMVEIAKARTRERYPDACQTCECVPCACGGEESQTPAARTGNRAGDPTNLNEDRQRLGFVPFCAKCNSAPCCCHIIAAREAAATKTGTGEEPHE